VAICTASGGQLSRTVISDDSGGATVTWEDYRSNPSTSYIYAQRISDSGTVLWPDTGVAICTVAGNQKSPIATPDGAGGAIVAWSDGLRVNPGIYAQRISVEGAVQWATEGVALCTFGIQVIVSDGAGGAIVAGEDHRQGKADIYAQRISDDGTVLWPDSGVAICTATQHQRYPAITQDGVGGAVVVWQDYRNDNQFGILADIYAQRVDQNGNLGVAGVPLGAPLALTLDPVRPNPSRGGALTVHFSLPTDAPAQLELLDVAGRRIASHEVGIGQHTLDLGQGQHVAPGLYLVRLTQGVNTRTTRAVVLN
jgi:hypothetical protein